MKKQANFKALRKILLISAAACVACAGSSRAQMVLISPDSTVNDGGFDDGSSTFLAYTGGNGYPAYQNIGSTGVTSLSAASGTLEWSVTNGYSATGGGFVKGVPNQTAPISFLENGNGKTITSESNLNYTVSVGDRFILTAYIADNTTGQNVTLTPKLSIGGDSDSLTGSGTSSGVANQFTLVTFTYVVPLGEDGDALNNVSLSTGGTGAQSYIDSIGLTVTPAGSAVPEPSTYALMALGLGALVVVARRRQTA